jgi:uncharacterized membrane protein YphA (DoxX/SURF4 family)
MAQDQNSSLVGPIVRSIVITVIVILLAAGLVWWVADWSTLYQYGTALIIGGILAAAFGLFGVAGGMRSTRSFNYQQAESAGLATGHDRAQESRQNLAEVYADLIVLGTGGCICVVLGLMLRLVA